MKQKMFIKKALSLLLAAVLVLSFSGCRNRNDEEENQNPEVTQQDELVIYHKNTDLAPMLMSLTEEYSKATGKKISAKLAGNDFLGEMKSQNGVLYIVDTHSDLSGWHSEGLLSDFLNDSGLSSLISKVPAGLQLNAAGIGSYGIPLMLEGYGYIFDKDMLSDIFGEENAEKLTGDLRTCSFTDFEGFVSALDTWISAPSAAELTVNGNKYTFAEEKTGKAQNLTGVFSLNIESTRAMEHLLSSALAAKFASRYEVLTAGEEAISEMEDIFEAYAEVLDFQTSRVAGAEGTIGRGEEFAGGDYNYSTSVDLFARGKALFYPGGTSDAADFEKSAEGFGENLDIIPMKLPLSEEEISAAGMTAEKLQSSIVIGSRYYLAINPNAEENLYAAARDFVNWLYNDTAGKTAYSSAFGGVPFNFEYLMGAPSGEENSSTAEGETNSETETESLPSEGAKTSQNSEGNQSLGEEQNSEAEPEQNLPEENPEMVGPMNPSHKISGTLMEAVAEYYSAGNWIPDLSFSLPADFSGKILGDSLSGYWAKDSWTESDREDFVDIIIGGWKNLIDKNNTAVG